jgi:hypothetical protein
MSLHRKSRNPDYSQHRSDSLRVEGRKDEKLKVVTKQNVEVVATIDGWSPDRARGYFDGETFRLQNQTPPRYALVGIDDYCLGFRAGYFNRQITRRA